jgi:hypothetical protein
MLVVQCQWLEIYAVRMHAKIVRSIFHANPKDYSQKYKKILDPSGKKSD